MTCTRQRLGMANVVRRLLSNPIVGGGRHVTYRRKNSNGFYNPATSTSTPDITDIPIQCFRAKPSEKRKNDEAGNSPLVEFYYNLPVSSLCDVSAGFIQPQTSDEIVDDGVIMRIVTVEGDSLGTYWRVGTVSVERETPIGV